MSEPFLKRWSRRKVEAQREAPPPPAEAPPAEPPPDLPPLESLGRDSDYTAFLREGVPQALRLAALRKAWSSDPAIAGFRGFAEYDWDFNAPGYGQLLPVDDVAALCRRALGEDTPSEPADTTPDKGTEEVEKPASATPMSAEGPDGPKTTAQADEDGKRSVPD